MCANFKTPQWDTCRTTDRNKDFRGIAIVTWQLIFTQIAKIVRHILGNFGSGRNTLAIACYVHENCEYLNESWEAHWGREQANNSSYVNLQT